VVVLTVCSSQTSGPHTNSHPWCATASRFKGSSSQRGTPAALYECEQTTPEVCKAAESTHLFLSNFYHLPVKVPPWEIPCQGKFCFTGNNCPQNASRWQQRISPATCSLLIKTLSGELADARGLPSRRTGRGAEHAPRHSRATGSARSIQQSFSNNCFSGATQ